MSIDFNDEILHDFLVEASEILESLNEQLVELEQTPQDSELLNAIFRGFHTIKGGAGFLNIDQMVEVCHKSEDIFNLLREGRRVVEADLMDAILDVADVLERMFESLYAQQEPTGADDQLLSALTRYASETEAEPQTLPTEETEVVNPAQVQGEDTAEEASDSVDAEFDALVSAAEPQQSAEGGGADEITADVFESLLDELHGSGQPSGTPLPKPAAESAKDGDNVESGDIGEDEFEALLDQLHGAGKSPGTTETAVADREQVVQEKAPAPVSKISAAKSPRRAAKKTKKGVDKPAAQTPAPRKPETLVRVNTERLDEIMNLVGELVLVRNRLSSLQERVKDEDIGRSVSNLDQVTSDLQTAVMKTRMQPIKKVFGRFPRVVRDLARQLGKQIELEMVGEDTDLDKNLVEALSDPLVHLVRNAVDHGIEDPETRVAAGKPAVGRVILSAQQEGDHILLRIDDDGRGMDPEVLRSKAVEKGAISDDEAALMSDQDAFSLIFQAGFSTKSEISDVSGRGVGMDVVRTKLNQLSAGIHIDSVFGQGSSIQIKVPLTLAILPALTVVLAGQRFALPLSIVHEILDLDGGQTNMVDHQEVMLVRDVTLPIFDLRPWLMANEPPLAEDRVPQVVTVEHGGRMIGLVVDCLIGQEEVVIKPLGAYVNGLAGFAGASVGGDGKIALILDVPSLMQNYAA